VAGRITKLLNRQTPERPDVTEAVAQLTRLAETRPDLRHPALLQSVLIRALYAVSAVVSACSLTAEEATRKLTGGVPLLRNISLPCAAPHLCATFLRLCMAASTVTDIDRQPYKTLAAAVNKQRLDLWMLGNALLAGAADTLSAQLTAHSHPPDLVVTLLRLALLPFLEQVATQLMTWRDGQPWGRGYCPTCGAWPVFAEQRGLEQRRYLRCGLCASSWEIDRLLCPFCATRDHALLGYLQVEGEEQQQRVATCDACQSYIKLRSTLTPLTTPQLLLEEVALLHLDLIVMAKGYVSPL